MTTLERTTVEEALISAARLEPDATASLFLANLRRNLFRAEEAAATVGRYELRSALGRGAMGTVFEAFDPVLHRRVALKILHKRAAISHQTQLSEARALAKLTHPNVVTVYEAGSTGEQVFIAMELVDGVDLAHWLRQRKRTWEEIVPVFGAAAAGLAAAHDAGLVHGDFKPANVLLSDKRVCVADFGMVRDTSPQALSSSISGGTPMYMAPERLDGSAASPASDQFAFFVSLLEALNGEAPFQATTLEGLRASMAESSGRRQFDPSVPRWLRELAERGVQLDARTRHPSMDAVVEALLRPREAIRRRRVTAAGVLLVVGGGAAWAGSASSAGVPPCMGAQAEADAIWSATRRAALAEAYASAEVGSFARGVAERSSHALDAYARAWVDARTEACQATTVRGERSAEILDRSMACLQRAATSLDTVVEQLLQADERTIHNAHKVIAGLPPLEPCADLEDLQQDVAPPLESEVDDVDAVRVLLARATVARHAGHYDEASDAVGEAEAALGDLEYEAIIDEVALARGRIAAKQGEFAAAERALTLALEGAAQRRRWPVMADASAALVRLVGDDLGRPDEGLRHAIVARGLARGDVQREAEVENNVGAVHLRQGDHDAAEAALRRGLELRLQAVPADHPDVLSARGNIAAILSAQGRFAEAEAEFRGLLAVSTDVLGADHPDTGVWANNLAATLYRQGEHEEAAEIGRALLATRIRTLGREHPYVATSHKQVAASLAAMGEYDEAIALMRESIELHEQVFGKEHPSTAAAHGIVVAILLQQAKYREAEVEARIELAIRQKAQGPEHADLGGTYQNHALALRGLGRLEDASADLERALAIRVATLGPDHPFVAHVRSSIAETHVSLGQYLEAEAQSRLALQVLTNSFDDDHHQVIAVRRTRARALVELQRWEDARAEAKRAWEASQRVGDSPAATADDAYVYALAQWHSSQDDRGRELARTLMRQAKTGYESATAPEHTEAIADAERWLREHS